MRGKMKDDDILIFQDRDSRKLHRKSQNNARATPRRLAHLLRELRNGIKGSLVEPHMCSLSILAHRERAFIVGLSLGSSSRRSKAS